MENKERKAKVTSFELDGRFVHVEYTQEDGQRVVGVFERVGWRRGPAEVQERVRTAFSEGTIGLAGRRQNS